MRKLTISMLSALLMGIFLFSSCSKEGSSGSTGPAGPAGPAGANGTPGVKGDKGDAGTANVVYSNWFDVIFLPQKNQVGDTVAWTATKAVTQLTNAILTSGDVKVYLNVGSAATPIVYPLPLTDFFAATGVSNLNMQLSAGSIFFYADEDAGTYTPTTGPGAGLKSWQYRFILIPGGTSTTARAASPVDWNNYSAVKKYLNLTD